VDWANPISFKELDINSKGDYYVDANKIFYNGEIVYETDTKNIFAFLGTVYDGDNEISFEYGKVTKIPLDEDRKKMLARFRE